MADALSRMKNIKNNCKTTDGRGLWAMGAGPARPATRAAVRKTKAKAMTVLARQASPLTFQDKRKRNHQRVTSESG